MCTDLDFSLSPSLILAAFEGQCPSWFARAVFSGEKKRIISVMLAVLSCSEYVKFYHVFNSSKWVYIEIGIGLILSLHNVLVLCNTV